MVMVRQKGTHAEIALRRELHRRGLRYQLDYEVLKKPCRVPDVASPALKIKANRVRDADTNSRLLDVGWTVLRFWERESPIEAAATVALTVAMAKAKHRISPAGPHRNN